VLTLTLAAGCGDDSESNTSPYCAQLESVEAPFIGLLNNEIGQEDFVAFKNSLPAVAATAPARLADDWETFGDAIRAFSAAMAKAGLTMDDMREMGDGPMAGGTDMQTAMDAAAALGSAEVSTAQSAIIANALSSCDINLNP